MINFSGIPLSSFIGIILRRCLSFIPKGFVIPIIQGPLRGTRWIVGSQTHGMWLGSYEIEKQLAIKHCLKPGQVFYDVGANVGYYSLLASRYVGPTGFVFAFEPLPRNIEYLSRHARLNKVSNLRIISKALSSHSGKVKFSYDNDPSSCHITSAGNLEVTVTTLDELLKDKSLPMPNIIKVDIEGAEIEFIKGAINTMIAQRPMIFMAIHSPQLFISLVKAIAEFKLPYKIKDMSGNEVNDGDYYDEVILNPF